MTVRAPWPETPYVPGQTARHPEDLFDAIKDTVDAGGDWDAVVTTPAFAAGMEYYRRGYFWEAHEVLEAVWMALPHGSAGHSAVQALIQTANAALKQKMNRPNAVRRLAGIARGHLADARAADPSLQDLDLSWIEAEILQLEDQLS